jgi:hypothetical protein
MAAAFVYFDPLGPTTSERLSIAISNQETLLLRKSSEKAARTLGDHT